MSLGWEIGFRRLIDAVSTAINITVTDNVEIITKLVKLYDVERGVETFAEFHRKYTPPTVPNNLAEDIRWILERTREDIHYKSGPILHICRGRQPTQILQIRRVYNKAKTTKTT